MVVNETHNKKKNVEIVIHGYELQVTIPERSDSYDNIAIFIKELKITRSLIFLISFIIFLYKKTLINSL